MPTCRRPQGQRPEQDEKGDGGTETGTPFASEGGGGPDSVLDEPRDRDEPQRSE